MKKLLKIFDKSFDLLKIIAISLFFIGTMILSIVMPKNTTSYFENRTLAVFPVLTKESLFDNSYFQNIEAYISDHLFLRETYIKVNTIKEMSKPTANNIVLTDEVVLPYFATQLEEYNYTDIDNMVTKLENLQEITEENGGNFLFVGVPEQSQVFQSYYPFFLNNSQYEQGPLSSVFFDYLENINYIDMNDYIGSDPIKYYSSTDHHYNLYGAYETYQQITSYINDNFVEIQTLEDVEILPLSEEFLGSRTRQLLGLYKHSDKLYTYNTSSHVEFERFDNGLLVDSTVFDNNNKSTYTYYMGGDKAETIIKTNRDELPNILILGDSFTNPLETMLYTSFNEQRSIDLRYYTENTLFEYINDYKPDVVIYIRDGLNYANHDGNGNIG